MNKSSQKLGQHWLFDQPTLRAVVDAGEVSSDDTVLEVGPGLGTLTQLLVERAHKVIAVEKDEKLAEKLARTVLAKNLKVISQDILHFDLTKLPKDYKIVANIPYYLTSNLLRQLLESSNPPKLMALMIQKEVAERIVANPPQMSVLAFSVQYYAQAKLIKMVPKELFSPPPKVDSAIIQIRRRLASYFPADRKLLFRIVKAGFSAKRKQLKNSLSAGLQITPTDCSNVLKNLRIDPKKRAQELTLDDWNGLYQALKPLLTKV